MYIKGEKTRAGILNAAAVLFQQKGYAAVTMSDLCGATRLSRGGLYRYFGSTEEVFLALLGADKDAWLQEMEDAFKKGVPAPEMLHGYLCQMRTGILRGEGRLSLAAYEYAVRVGGDFAAQRYRIAVEMFRRLLEYGQLREEFGSFDPQLLAERNVILMDGLRMAAAVLPLDAETVDRQLTAIEIEVKGQIV